MESKAADRYHSPQSETTQFEDKDPRLGRYILEDLELAIEYLGPPGRPTFSGVLKVPDPQAPAWRRSQI